MEGFLGLKRNILVLKQERLFSLNYFHILKKKKEEKNSLFCILSIPDHLQLLSIPVSMT